MQHFSSWVSGFPGLLWSLDIPPSRLRVFNQWSVPGLDLPRFLKDARYRKQAIRREDYPLLVEFNDMAAARLPAAVIFRLNREGSNPLHLQGWPGPEGKSYCGLLKEAFLPAAYAIGGFSGTCQMALGGAGYPVFVIDVSGRAVVADNQAARELFGLNPTGDPTSVAAIAPAEHAEQLLEACFTALEEDVWAGTLTFRNAAHSLFSAKVRLTLCGSAEGEAVRVALLNIPESNAEPDPDEELPAPPLPNRILPLHEGLEALFSKYAGELDGLMFSDIRSTAGRVTVYGVGPAFAALDWGSEHAYEGTIAQEIERFGLHSLTVEETLDSIKSIDWVLFAPHGVRSYFAKPFYKGRVLHAVLILASRRPEAFGSDAEQHFRPLFQPFERLIRHWRQA